MGQKFHRFEFQLIGSSSELANLPPHSLDLISKARYRIVPERGLISKYWSRAREWRADQRLHGDMARGAIISLQCQPVISVRHHHEKLSSEWKI